MARRRYSGDALIEILHLAQQLYGYLSRPLLKRIAHALKLPPSRVLGVATFYHLFRLEPPRAHSAVVCMGTACYAAGAPELLRRIVDATRPSGDWTVRTGRCVGSCGLAPSVVCDGAPLARVSGPEALERATGPLRGKEA
jgi:bidirectional [NiFe] hydrogenase diaphorase subunit